LFVVPEAPARLAGATRLGRQDAVANISKAEGPKGEPQDAASLSSFMFKGEHQNWIPGSVCDEAAGRPGMTRDKISS
jgi:hypothetical protein